MKILKFGGTSVRDAQAMQQVDHIIQTNGNTPLLVVLSATAGTTNALLQMVEMASTGSMGRASALKKKLEQDHRAIIKELGLEDIQSLKNDVTALFSTLEVLLIGVYYLREATPRVKDAFAAHGELLSTRIFAAWLQKAGQHASWFDAREVMLTDKQFGSARPDREALQKAATEKLLPMLSEGQIVVTQGFIGATKEGLTTTLGRGGSDYTAALLGHALDAESIEIWTDVSGVMTADPRMVETAFTQRDLSFREAAELAYFGARVLHPSTILPAVEKSIPVSVRNTLQPQDTGTEITFDSRRPGVVKAIAFRKSITTLTVESSRMLMAYGFLEKIFNVFSRHHISVDLISTSEISVSLTVDDVFTIDEVIQELSEFSKVRITYQNSIISLVGEQIKESPHFLGTVFQALDGIPIEMITFGASNVNLSLLVPDDHLSTAVTRLHDAFFEKTAGTRG